MAKWVDKFDIRWNKKKCNKRINQNGNRGIKNIKWKPRTNTIWTKKKPRTKTNTIWTKKTKKPIWKNNQRT